MDNSIDSDQLASSELSGYGSLLLKIGYIQLSGKITANGCILQKIQKNILINYY